MILVSGHFTTLEICGRLLCERVPLAGMYRPHAQGPLEWAVKRGRLRYAVAMFGREELRPAIRHLKSGGVLWFAPDQETRRGDSVFVPFFGRPASSLTSTHQMARLSGAAVLAFAHGHSLRVLGARWLGLSVPEARILYLDTASISVLGHDREAPVIRRWNA